MKRVVLDVSDDMHRKIDEMVLRDGFATRSEFLRFLIVSYFNKKRVVSGNTETSDADQQEKEGKKLYYGHPEEDFEFGIPKDVVEKIFEEAGVKNSGDESRPPRQS